MTVTPIGNVTFVPTDNVPNPTCCNVAGALCPHCEVEARRLRRADRRRDLLPLPEPLITVNKNIGRDSNPLPLPNTMEQVINARRGNNAAGARERMYVVKLGAVDQEVPTTIL